MEVGELIKALEAFDPALTVVMQGSEVGARRHRGKVLARFFPLWLGGAWLTDGWYWKRRADWQ